MPLLLIPKCIHQQSKRFINKINPSIKHLPMFENYTAHWAQQLTPIDLHQGKSLENTRYSYLHTQCNLKHPATALSTSGGID